MEKLTVTKTYKSNKDKDGNLFKDRNGKNYWKVAVKFDKYGDDWYSTLVFREDDPLMKLEEGTEKLFVIDTSNGYKNFKMPSRLDVLEARLEKLEQRVGSMNKQTPTDETVYPEGYPSPSSEGIKPEDIPF